MWKTRKFEIILLDTRGLKATRNHRSFGHLPGLLQEVATGLSSVAGRLQLLFLRFEGSTSQFGRISSFLDRQRGDGLGGPNGRLRVDDLIVDARDQRGQTRVLMLLEAEERFAPGFRFQALGFDAAVDRLLAVILPEICRFRLQLWVRELEGFQLIRGGVFKDGFDRGEVALEGEGEVEGRLLGDTVVLRTAGTLFGDEDGSFGLALQVLGLKRGGGGVSRHCLGDSSRIYQYTEKNALYALQKQCFG
ncbi:hypothetical protein L596_020209 [Steinernema carpocapsae]|nr:hypothetical protein L596_020209 [Steinernema carpocapsae]